jgi:hypothetical protein
VGELQLADAASTSRDSLSCPRAIAKGRRRAAGPLGLQTPSPVQEVTEPVRGGRFTDRTTFINWASAAERHCTKICIPAVYTGKYDHWHGTHHALVGPLIGIIWTRVLKWIFRSFKITG